MGKKGLMLWFLLKITAVHRQFENTNSVYGFVICFHFQLTMLQFPTQILVYCYWSPLCFEIHK